jgi:tagaturonate reductase
MNLSHFTLKNISTEHITVPDGELLDLPERVLQFGTGMLLRGLPDYYIDKANRKGIFNGRIVVVKSTSNGDASAFEKQDGLYTICERGISQGKKIEEATVSSAISRVLVANHDWEEILLCAHNPEINIIISNTTEMGIQLVKDDIRNFPPVSFPGKLLSVLYERFIAFDGEDDSGFVIIPTELLPDNGKKLEAIVMELAHLNGLDDTFIEWLERANCFCNSLVDRIVTGMPPREELNGYFNWLGYHDELLTVTEVYSLWAIEGDEHIKNRLSFWEADDGIKIEPDIDLYRELKLRLLNGTHTLACGIAFLSQIPTVYHAMEDHLMSGFLQNLMLSEIAPAIPLEIDEETTTHFTHQVLDRFRNPYIRHHWKTIAQNYSQKMKLRCVPLLMNHYSAKDDEPSLLALGFAAYLRFMKAEKEEQGQFFGKANDAWYLIEDERAKVFFLLWKNNSMEDVVKKILNDTGYWGEKLFSLPGFYESVIEYMKQIDELGMRNTIESVIKQKTV